MRAWLSPRSSVRRECLPRGASWREFVAERVPLRRFMIAGCALAWLGAFLVLFFTSSSRRVACCRLSVPSGCSVVGAGLSCLGYLADPRVSERNMAVVSDKGGLTLLAAPADQSATVMRLPGAAPLRVLGPQRRVDFLQRAGRRTRMGSEQIARSRGARRVKLAPGGHRAGRGGSFRLPVCRAMERPNRPGEPGTFSSGKTIFGRVPLWLVGHRGRERKGQALVFRRQDLRRGRWEERTVWRGRFGSLMPGTKP